MADGKLTDISATGGLRVHLHYNHPLGRLTEVKRIVGDQAVETLVTYRYDDNGQLSQVSNRNGDTLHYFSYADRVMTRHSTTAVKKKGSVDVELNFFYGNGGTRPTSIIYDVHRQVNETLEGLFGN